MSTEQAIFASGCFWGTQFYIDKAEGVMSTEVGYTGGHVPNPTYKQVCGGDTGHAEGILVTYDPQKISYRDLAKLFFETHDPGQVNGQGPDIGEQYRSAIFYKNEEQKKTAEELIGILRGHGNKVVTELTPASTFYKSEDYHQHYYEKGGGSPYCHRYIKKF